MQVRPGLTEIILDGLRTAQFGMMDVLRRAQGDVLETFGLGPNECTYRIAALDSYWRLRDYGHESSSIYLLVVAAPIKRPYIWDLSPSTSAIRYCLDQGLHIYVLEWIPASRGSANNGLDEYASAIANCIAHISAHARSKPFLIGHSLGGTLAAIYAGLAAESLRGVVLLGAPLCFEPHTTGFRDALVSIVPPNLPEAEPFPGSLLSQMSALASPASFVWSRLMDAVLSTTDYHALDVHARVERWALDEVPLPGKLVLQIVEWLYRENRFCRGLLKICDAQVGPSSITVPILAVVNMADDVAPLASIKPFIDAIPATGAHILEYPGEIGVCLQHLGVLVGRQAREKIWPQIISWLRSS